MRRSLGRTTRTLEPDYTEPDGKVVPPADLEKKRREYVFDENSRLKQARIEDIRGMPHVVEEIKKFIAFLKDYQKFKEINVRIQPGVLLHGEPGTGKTLTARVIATESGAKLINAGGFPRGEKGWAAADISSLFALVREYHAQTAKPVIIYFDEFDEVCPNERRYRSEASPALMTELDGVGGKPEGIFVIASANSRDIDNGLLRAGRLGYHVDYRPPDCHGRTEVLKFYLEKKPHEPIDLEGLAEIMPDMTPAEIEEIIERAYMNLCLVSSSPKLTELDLIEQVLEEVMDSRTDTWHSAGDRYRVCVHEAGHVIVGQQLGCPVKLVVVSKKYEGGGTLFGSWDEELRTPGQMENRIAAMYGGEAAEEVIFGERHFGGTNDVGKATDFSIKLVATLEKTTNYDCADRTCGIDENRLTHPLDDGERSSIYSEARRIRERCYQRAKEVLEDFGKGGIERVARQIVEREFLLGQDVERAVLENDGGQQLQAGQGCNGIKKEVETWRDSS